MSQSPLAASPTQHEHGNGASTVTDAEEVQSLLDVLQDPACRDILEATSDEALSANEISETCDLPLSTAYRKLELLTEADMLVERTRIRRSGKHTSEYGRVVEGVVVSVAEPGETELEVRRRDGHGVAHGH